MKALLLSLLAIPLLVISKEGDQKEIPKTYRAVFEAPVDGVERWEGAPRNVEKARKALGESATTIEVVAHGKGIGLLLLKTGASQPELKEKLRKLHGKGVIFAACENTMARMNLAKQDLDPGAVTVDSGVAEVVRKQSEGWGVRQKWRLIRRAECN